MAIFNRERGFVYTFEPHTASRATKEYLLKVRGSSEIQPHHATVEQLFQGRRAVLRASDKLGKITVATVRNPLDWILTRYWSSNHRRLNPQEFKPWLQQWIDNKDAPLFGKHAAKADRLVYYETLKEDLDDFLIDLGIAESDLPEMRVVGKTSGKPDWREFYTSDLVKMVQDGFPEMRAYGYDIWYFSGSMNVTISRGNNLSPFG